MVDFYDERDFVGVLPGIERKHAKGGSHAIAARFDGQTDDVFRLEIFRVFVKGKCSSVLDSLVNGQYAQITSAPQVAMPEKLRQIAQHLQVAVAVDKYFFQKIGGRKR